MTDHSRGGRVLLASELGAGRGHLARLAPIADALLARGHTVRLLAPNPSSTASVFADIGGGASRFGSQEVPPRRPSRSADRPVYTMADELNRLGFADPGFVEATMGWWCRQLEQWRPDLVIADFSPSACLASAGRFPTISVGSGYTIPPDLSPLPALRPWQQDVPLSSRQTEDLLVDVLAQTARRHGRWAPERVADVFRGNTSIVSTWPWFDPYRGHRNEPVYPPFNVSLGENPGPIRNRPSRSVFAYLPGGRRNVATVCAVAAADRLRGTVFLGEDASPAEELPEGLLLARSAPDLREVLPNVGLAIHHAGLGTASACLLAGTPQLVFPDNLERHITAYGLRRLGVAAVFSALTRPTTDQIRQSIKELRHIAETEDRFLTLARQLRQHASTSGLDAVLQIADSVVGS